jgi:hypothetical protein
MINYPTFLQTELIQKLLKLSSEYNWPPQEWVMQSGKPGIPFLWNPSKLESNSGDLVKIHSLVILKELGKRAGAACPIDLYKWFWKEVLIQYLTVLPPRPRGFEIPRNLPTKNTEQTTAIVDPESKEFFGDHLAGLNSLSGPDDVFKKLCEKNLTRHPLVYWQLGQSTMEDILPEPLKERLFDATIQLRIKLWWGWPDAPFCCIESIIKNTIQILAKDEVLTLIDQEQLYPPKLASYLLTKKGREILRRKTQSGTIEQVLEKMEISEKNNSEALDFWASTFTN